MIDGIKVTYTRVEYIDKGITEIEKLFIAQFCFALEAYETYSVDKAVRAVLNCCTDDEKAKRVCEMVLRENNIVPI